MESFCSVGERAVTVVHVVRRPKDAIIYILLRCFRPLWCLITSSVQLSGDQGAGIWWLDAHCIGAVLGLVMWPNRSRVLLRTLQGLYCGVQESMKERGGKGQKGLGAVQGRGSGARGTA